MRTRTIILTVTLPSLALSGWTAMAMGKDAREKGGDRSLGGLERAEARVRSRLCMPPCMEVELENGVDPVEEARALGLIVEATLEEVEGALSAAALTPEKADDVKAIRMLQFGSYRFYPETGEQEGGSRGQ